MRSSQFGKRTECPPIEKSKGWQSLRKRLKTREVKATRDHLIDRDIARLPFTETLIVRHITTHNRLGLRKN